MKAFVIWQPWASLVMIGAKPYEFRARSYLAYIGHPEPGDRIAIHAGARPVRRDEVEDLLARLDGPEDTTGLVVDLARELLLRVRDAHKCRLLPLGAALGTAVIGKPRNAGTIFGRRVSEDVRGFYSADELDELDGQPPLDSDRGEFNWAWPLSDIQPFPAPIPMRGMQGFWEWPMKLEAGLAMDAKMPARLRNWTNNNG